MSKKYTCLNCNALVTDKFCPSCGQKKIETQRITFKHFFLHDILHGVWHFERGILFTLKEAVVRPGNAALDYIAGKRVRYYNVFYLVLVLIGLGIFIENAYAFTAERYVSFIEPEIEPEEKSVVLDFIGKHIKLFLALAIPVFSLNSYVLFNKRKLYYSEHIIIFGLMYLGIILFTILSNILYFTEFVKPLTFISEWTDIVIPVIILLYVINGFYKAFGNDYSKLNFSLRMLIYIVLTVIELRLLGTILKVFLVK